MSAGRPHMQFVIPDGAGAPIRDSGAGSTDVSCPALGPGALSGTSVARNVEGFGPRLAGMTIRAGA